MGVNLSEWNRSFQGQKKGSFATRNRAFTTWRALDQFVDQKGWRDVRPETITPKQMRLFLEHRAEEIGARSLQNEASHLRRALGGSGRDIGNVRDPKNTWSNDRMGVDQASRFGGRAAMSESVFERAREHLREDVRACADLQRCIGLRREESIQAGRSLDQWKNALDQSEKEGRGAFLEVRDGTKGGRERCVWVPLGRVQEVREVIERVREVCRAGKIIDAAGLKQAKTVYSNEMRRAGLVGENSGHGLRRAFAQEQYAIYREAGFDERDALARLSQDLGHGDGRGRWVWNNYLAGGEGA